ncbi:MAG: hypothetical protein ACPGSC_13550, partial [Granulosicoccaceae bacterium]
AIVRQLGIEPLAYARNLIEREGGAEQAIAPFNPDIDKPGPYLGRGNDNEWGERYADILTRLMAADLALIPEAYDRACQLEYPGGQTGHSHADVDVFWTGLRASFPYAE